MKSTFATLLTLTLLAAGCDTGEDSGITGGRGYPKIGSHVDVQFRRGMLGLASEKPTTPMGEGMNMSLGSSGILKHITDDFVVLQVHNEPNRELWIPRDTILLMDVKRPAE
jgi:hypothetical protein